MLFTLRTDKLKSNWTLIFKKEKKGGAVVNRKLHSYTAAVQTQFQYFLICFIITSYRVIIMKIKKWDKNGVIKSRDSIAKLLCYYRRYERTYVHISFFSVWLILPRLVHRNFKKNFAILIKSQRWAIRHRHFFCVCVCVYIFERMIFFSYQCRRLRFPTRWIRRA